MEYSAGLVSRHYWYLETKKTAKLMTDGLSKDDIRNLVITENIYQAPSEQGSIHMFGPIFTRLSSLDDFLRERIVDSDIGTSKALTLLAIMKTDQLFFEFMNEVYREKIRFADLIINDSDVSIFFHGKLEQSEAMAKWTEATMKRLKNCYTRLLYECGLIEKSAGDRRITPINLDYATQSHLKENGYTAYYNALTGEM